MNPLERIMMKVRYIAQNPLAAANQNFEFHQLDLLELVHKEDGKRIKDKTLETELLEQAITKISHLLVLGFGEAGSSIIASCMSNGSELNPIQAGRRVHAVFGFCDIRNFTDSTEILQTKVMTFVNQIAEITHTCVNKFGGAANKNIGDAFLLVWKFKLDGETEYIEAVNDENITLSDR